MQSRQTFSITGQMIEHLKMIGDDVQLGKALVALFRSKVDGCEFKTDDRSMDFIMTLLANDMDKAKCSSERQRKYRNGGVTVRNGRVTVDIPPVPPPEKEKNEREISPHTPYIEKESKERDTPPSYPQDAHACDSAFCDENMAGIINTSFDAFWRVYPRRVAKNDAVNAFVKITKSMSADEIIEFTDMIVSVVGRQSKSFDWTKDNGKYIPYPATWLNGERWNDVLESDISEQEKSENEMRASKLLEGMCR